MNVRHQAASLIVVLVGVTNFAGCVSRPSPIPNGAYSSSRTRERVTVRPAQLTFDLRIPRKGEGYRVIKVARYRVHPDGEIWTSGYGSAEYASTFGWFDWYWDGTRIIRITRTREGSIQATYFDREP